MLGNKILEYFDLQITTNELIGHGASTEYNCKPVTTFGKIAQNYSFYGIYDGGRKSAIVAESIFYQDNSGGHVRLVNLNEKSRAHLYNMIEKGSSFRYIATSHNHVLYVDSEEDENQILNILKSLHGEELYEVS